VTDSHPASQPPSDVAVAYTALTTSRVKTGIRKQKFSSQTHNNVIVVLKVTDTRFFEFRVRILD